MAKRALGKSKEAKRDEFYTRLEDVEQELDHYRNHFEGKVIYLNCDNPEFSSFWQYFSCNFDSFGLKKLMATHYASDGESSYTLMMEEQQYDASIVREPLEGNGDFRSGECIELLKEADIVATNPPFSLFREYMAQLLEYDKKFIILGSQNAFTYKEIFPLLKDNIIWTGYKSGGMAFRIPDHYPDKSSTYIGEDGHKYQQLGNICWFTNLEISELHEEMVLTRFYEGNEEAYPMYDNYEAIEVSKVKEIPMDYTGVMGVPITFFNKHNPNQFEILGMTKTPICYDNNTEAKRTKIYENVTQHSKKGKTSSGNKVNDGPTLLLNNPLKNKTYYTTDNIEGYLIAPYARILIVNKKPVSRAEILGF